MSTSIPNLIIQQIVAGVKVGMGWNETQVFSSLLPVLDVGWQGQIQVQVIGGDERPYEGGLGGQYGGELLRTYDVDLIIYYRLNLDVHGESGALLTTEQTGLNDTVELIRQIFQSTYLGFSNGLSNSEYVLFEPMYFKNKTRPAWEDEDNSIVKITLTYTCNFGMNPFSSISLTPEQITSI
jgi:hypothetical protein